jgi:hypothetical protein
MERSMSRKAIVVVAGCLLSLAGGGCDASSDGGGSGTGAVQQSGAGGAAGVGGGSGGAAGAGGAAGVGGAAGAGGAAGMSMTAGSGGMAANAMAGAGAGVGGGGAGGAAGDMPIDPGDFDYSVENVMLTETLTIAAGETVHVGPGTTFTASAGVKIQINGTLVVSGSADSKVKFLGAGVPRSWEGIVIGSGGNLQLTHAEIGGATHGIYAEAGSSYTVDYAEIGTSFKCAILFADGSFDHTKFHASGDDTFSPVNEVSVADVNGTLTIIDASPTISNSSFDNSSPLVDMIRVGGSGAPVFDHIKVVGAHCGFHTNGGVNNQPVVRNSVLEGMSYGIMAYTSKAIFENNNFMGNSADIGFCFGATAENSVQLSGNFYSSGSASLDPTCFEITTADPSPAAAAHAGAGPVGL